MGITRKPRLIRASGGNLVRTNVSGRRGRIQMRVQQRFIWTANNRQVKSASTGCQRRAESSATQMVRSPWRNCRNSGRSNEAGEAARKSEREAEPSTASSQITRNGRCRSGSPQYLDAQRGVQRNTKTATSTGA